MYILLEKHLDCTVIQNNGLTNNKKNKQVVRCPYIYFHLLQYTSWCSGSIQSPRLDNLPLGSSDLIPT